jgi:hypothetical protein
MCGSKVVVMVPNVIVLYFAILEAVHQAPDGS